MKRKFGLISPAAMAAAAGLSLSAALFAGGNVAQAAELPDSNIIQAHEGVITNSAGARQNDQGPDGTAMGGSFEAGDYLAYQGVNFDGQYNTCLMEIAAPEASDGKTVELHLDSPDGQLIGAVEIAVTDDMAENDTEEEMPLFGDHYAAMTEGITGEHDLYLVFPEAAQANIDFFAQLDLAFIT